MQKHEWCSKLWSWNGVAMALVEEAISHVRYWRILSG